MCTYSASFKFLIPAIIFIFMSLFMTLSEGEIICPFVETLSFGSNINVKCNKSYLIINQSNADGLNWVFADETESCNQTGSQQAFVNQCGIRRMGSNYLTVPLKSSESNGRACVYCQIDSKPIAPVMHVVQRDEDQRHLFIFNITATGLAMNESFEILWAKRAHDTFRHSYTYWFLQQCLGSLVEIRMNTAHTIVFAVDDVSIYRVEFILRRCNGTCRTYEKCDEQRFHSEINSNSFRVPDSIEKISCDSLCLTGRNPPSSIPIMTHRPREISSFTSTTTTTTTKAPSNPEEIIKLAILVTSIGIFSSIIFVLFIRYVIRKPTVKEHVYTKTSSVDPDEHK